MFHNTQSASHKHSMVLCLALRRISWRDFQKSDLSGNMMEEKAMFSTTRFSPFKILVTEKDSNWSVLFKLKSMKKLYQSKRKTCLNETVWESYYWYNLNILNTSYSLFYFPSIRSIRVGKNLWFRIFFIYDTLCKIWNHYKMLTRWYPRGIQSLFSK